MRIDEIHVEGFGLLRDQRIEPAPGLTLIRGENEAGKSTLLAFIRAILFGFDPKNPGALAGGRRGGWLTVTPADGRPVRIERYGISGGGGQLRLLDRAGDDLGPELLTRILQGVDKPVFRNIFAFGLAELTEFETLTGPAIADRIYGAGMGTGATSVVDVENALEKVRSDIFVKRGRVPRINVLLAEIDELESRIESINPPQTFAAAGERRRSLETDLAGLSSQIEAGFIRRRRLERLRDGWPSWLALEAARSRLADLPAEVPGRPGFAADLLERLAGVERELVQLAERRDELRADHERSSSEHDALAVDERLLAARPDAEVLLAGVPEARSDRARLADLERDVVDRSAAVAEALRRLGPGWDEDRVLAVDDSLAAQGAILSQFRPALDGAERELAGTRAAAAAAEKDEADARDELELVAGTGSVVAFDRIPPAGPARPALAWTLIGLLIGLVAGEAGLLGGLPPPIALLIGVVAGALVALVGIRAQATRVHLESRTDPVDRSRAARLEERADRVRLLEDRARTAAGRLLTAETAHEAVLAGWHSWLAGHGLPVDLDRETAGRLLEGTAQVRAGLAALAAIRARRDELAARLADYETRGGALLGMLGRPADDPISGLDGIRRDLAATVAAAAERDRSDTELERIQAAETGNAVALDAALAEHAAILAEGGVAEPAALRPAVAAAAQRAAIEREVTAADHTLVALSGPGGAVAAFKTDLAGIGDLARIQADLEVEVERDRALEARRASLLEGLGAERETIGRIERSSEAAELRQQRADRIAELADLAQAWSVTSIALALLRRTRERYEREHRPDVLKAAEELLSAWTGRRYVRILAPLGKQVQELERNDGVIVPLGGLSMGTAQQLYLALRFGLVDHFARQAESLPVVMDDILVNFDPERAERAARSIEDLATRHQVLYFTCHPDTPLNATREIELPAVGRN